MLKTILAVAAATACLAPAGPAGALPTAQDPALPGRFKLRPDGQRLVQLEPGGVEFADAIERGLDWLAAQQEDDGRWAAARFADQDERCGKPTNDVGVTGLALLALLAEGSTVEAGPYARGVARGCAWLVSQQGEHGRIGAPHVFYNHAIATWALCEAAGLSADDQKLHDAAQLALGCLETYRNPYAGWRYQMRDNDNDTSMTAWCTLANLAGRELGFDVPAPAFACAERWFERVTDPKSGRTGYTARGGSSSRMAGDHGERFPREAYESMTAAALACRLLQNPTAARREQLAHSIALLARSLPRWDVEDGGIDMYGWHFASLALRQCGGEVWRRFREALRTEVIPNQRSGGPLNGSWDPLGVWGEEGGRLYSTALVLLTLQASYRFEAPEAEPWVVAGGERGGQVR